MNRYPYAAMLIALGIRPKIMKFLFEKFIAPNATGKYGSGDIAAIGTIIFPYLFVR